MGDGVTKPEIEPVFADGSIAKALAEAKPPLSDYTKPLTDAGFEQLQDLGTDEPAVRKSLSKIKAMKDKPGVVNRIVSLWTKDKQAREAPPEEDPEPVDDGEGEVTQPKPPADPMEAPKLPVGATLDLSYPEVKLDDVTWKIPDGLAVSTNSDKVTIPTTPADWVVLARKTRMMYGLHLDRVLSASASDQRNARANEAALVWKVPESDDFVDTNAVGFVESTLHYTATMSNLVHNSIVDASVSVGTPFVSGAARAARDERQASSEEHKHLWMTGIWRYTQATLTLKDCTAASPKFLAAIDEALKAVPAQQFKALDDVFNRFGHVVPESVTLGGQLYFQSDQAVTGEVDEEAVKTTVSAAVKAKGDGVAGSAEASFSDGSGKRIQSQSIAQSSTFTCVGGDTFRASTPSDWPVSVKDPNSWAVVERRGLTPLVDWLDADKRSRVVQIWEAGLKRLWGDKTPPRDYAKPDFDNKPFTISGASAAQSGWAISSCATLENATHTEDAGWWGMVAAVPATRLSNPAGNSLLWELVFTGWTTEGSLRGRPLYWIVAYPRQRPPVNAGLTVLSAWGESWWFATLKDRRELQAFADHPEASPASWTLNRLNPGDAADKPAVYQIQNYLTGRLLGPVPHGDNVPKPQEFPKPPTDKFEAPRVAVLVSEPASSVGENGWVCSTYDVTLDDVRTDVMRPGEGLAADWPLYSTDGRYQLVFQGDGNLVLYDVASGGKREVWATHTNNKGRLCTLEFDGNLVIWDKDRGRVWESALQPKYPPRAPRGPGCTLCVQRDANVVIYNPENEPVWAIR
jgi:hypothetical protein